MASKIPNSSLFNTVSRGYAARAKGLVRAPSGLQVSKDPCGIIVASADTYSSFARIGVFVRAGSRYESIAGVPGVLQCLTTGGLGSQARTGRSLVNTTEFIGGRYNCTAGREVLSYAVGCPRDEVGEALSILATVTGNDQYSWFYHAGGNDPTQRSDTPLPEFRRRLDMQCDASLSQLAVDLAVKAAYRAQPLGNSIYTPSYNRSKIIAPHVNEFVRETHGPEGLVLVGLGVDHNVLLAGASALGLAGAKVKTQGAATKYLAGDVRVGAAGSSAGVAVLGEGAKLGSNESVALLVASHVLGASGGEPHKLLARAMKGAPGSARGVSLSFSDAGLFGFALEAPDASAPETVTALVAALRKASVSDKEVQAAKSSVKQAISESEVGCSGLESFGSQLLLTGNYSSSEEVCRAVDSVTAAAVNKAISQSFSGKLSVGATGSVNDIPYSDTL